MNELVKKIRSAAVTGDRNSRKKNEEARKTDTWKVKLEERGTLKHPVGVTQNTQRGTEAEVKSRRRCE